MAHSDVLIFLTNITWIFFLFFFTYFFFVVFFLPTFYKKFRFRSFFKNVNELKAVKRFIVMFDFLAVSANIMGAYLLDFAVFLALQISKIYKVFFNIALTSFSSVFQFSTLLINFSFSGLTARYNVVSKFLRSLDDGSYSLVTKYLSK